MMTCSSFILVVEQCIQRTSRFTLWCYAAAWYGFISYLSHTPSATSSSTAELVGGSDILNSVLRWYAHIVVFGILGLLLYAAQAHSYRFTQYYYFSTLIVVLLLAIFDELHQSYVPGRHARIQDVMTDCIGAAFSVGLMCYWYRRATMD